MDTELPGTGYRAARYRIQGCQVEDTGLIGCCQVRNTGLPGRGYRVARWRILG
jgi:hypothetical protein